MKKILLIIVVLIAQSSYGQPAIKIEKTGKGAPILFLPGFTTPGSVWDETINNINGNYESHRVSYAGFDGMAPIEMPWYSKVKEELKEYIKKEKLKNLIIIGHSMGGNLAIEVVSDSPELVSKIIFVESIPCMRELMMLGVSANDLVYDSPYNKQILDMGAAAFSEVAKATAQNMTNNSSKMDLLIDWIETADRATYVYGYTDLLKLDLRDKLKTINIKTLIIGAAASYPDPDVVLSNYNKQYENLRSKEIVIAQKSKHFVMFDEPEWFYEQMNTFLSK